MCDTRHRERSGGQPARETERNARGGGRGEMLTHHQHRCCCRLSAGHCSLVTGTGPHTEAITDVSGLKRKCITAPAHPENKSSRTPDPSSMGPHPGERAMTADIQQQHRSDVGESVLLPLPLLLSFFLDSWGRPATALQQTRCRLAPFALPPCPLSEGRGSLPL